MTLTKPYTSAGAGLSQTTGQVNEQRSHLRAESNVDTRPNSTFLSISPDATINNDIFPDHIKYLTIIFLQDQTTTWKMKRTSLGRIIILTYMSYTFTKHYCCTVCSSCEINEFSDMMISDNRTSV